MSPRTAATCLSISNNGSAPQNELFYVDLGDPKKPAISGAAQAALHKERRRYTTSSVTTARRSSCRRRSGRPRRRIVAARPRRPDAGALARRSCRRATGVIESSAMAAGRILVHYEVVARSRLALFSTDGTPRANSASGARLGHRRLLSQRLRHHLLRFHFVPLSRVRLPLRRQDGGKRRPSSSPTWPSIRLPTRPKQVFYPSKDGTKIPMFIVAKRGVRARRQQPDDPLRLRRFRHHHHAGFSPMLPVWLELGGVYASANLRGGGDYGEKWHEAGKLGQKQNVFDDFAWAAEVPHRAEVHLAPAAGHPRLLERRACWSARASPSTRNSSAPPMPARA